MNKFYKISMITYSTTYILFILYLMMVTVKYSIIHDGPYNRMSHIDIFDELYMITGCFLLFSYPIIVVFNLFKISKKIDNLEEMVKD